MGIFTQSSHTHISTHTHAHTRTLTLTHFHNLHELMNSCTRLIPANALTSQRLQQASSDEQLVKKAMAGMDTDEVQFSVEMPIQHNVMLWSDKYRPRKPRFFNRVHTVSTWGRGYYGVICCMFGYICTIKLAGKLIWPYNVEFSLFSVNIKFRVTEKFT